MRFAQRVAGLLRVLRAPATAARMRGHGETTRSSMAVACLLSAFVSPVFAQPAPDISLLTFAPGEIYWQRFGHNAILVRDAARGEARVYNYGIFDFQQKNFFLNFARGRMLYRLDEAPLDWTLRLYAAEGRWAVEQQLALDEGQRRKLADFLEWNARPENAEYRYDYFVANCSTQARDALDLGLDGSLRAALQARPGTTTFRNEVLRLMAPVPALMLGMDLGLGPRVDAPLNQWQEGFIPMRLMAAVRDLRIADGSGAQRPLVSAERRLLPAGLPQEPAQPPALGGIGLAAGLILAAVLGAMARTRPGSGPVVGAYGVVCGLAGTVLLLGWLATDHWGMAANRNLLLLNPLWLLLPSVRGRRTRAVLLALLGAGALAALPVALSGVQPNLHWVALLLPAHLVVVAAGLRRCAAAPAC